MANIYSKKEFKELITNYYSTKDIKDILKEVKKYLKEEKKEEEICELIGGTSYDSFIFFENEEITHITLGKTRYVGNFLKKNLRQDNFDIKKIKQDIIEESVIITIDYAEKEIKGETPVIIEYKDGYIENGYYKIVNIDF